MHLLIVALNPSCDRTRYAEYIPEVKQDKLHLYCIHPETNSIKVYFIRAFPQTLGGLMDP